MAPSGQRFALIMAGGSGVRFGAPQPKQMVNLSGAPVLVHTLRKFLGLSPDLVTCTVLHGSLLPDWQAFCRQWFPQSEHSRMLACEGGATRTASVNNGLDRLFKQAEASGQHDGLVAIHDGVRPLVPVEVLEAAYGMAEEKGNAVVAVPVKSSMRRRTLTGSEAVDRSDFFHVQTPQVFRLAEILSAYGQRPHDNFTDDAGLAEHFGMRIHLCEGSYDNLKITTPEDLIIAEFLLKRQK